MAAVRKDTALAYLCSPTDVFALPKEAAAAAKANFAAAPLWQKAIAATSKTLLKQNVGTPIDGVDDTKHATHTHLIDGLVPAQGPNYALAKRLQHWRAMVARADGHMVSTNIAPPSATLRCGGRVCVWGGGARDSLRGGAQRHPQPSVCGSVCGCAASACPRARDEGGV